MKKILIISLIGGLLSSCGSHVHETNSIYKTHMEAVNYCKSVKLFPGSTLYADCVNKFKEAPFTAVPEGEATVPVSPEQISTPIQDYCEQNIAGDWEQRCSTSNIDDSRACFLMYGFAYNNKYDQIEVATVTVSKSGDLGIVGDGIDSRRDIYFRVDKNKALQPMARGRDAAFFRNASPMIRQMQTGKTLLVAFDEWPSGYSQEKFIPLDCFARKFKKLP